MKYNYLEEIKNDIVFLMQDEVLDWSDYDEFDDFVDELYRHDEIIYDYGTEEEYANFLSGNLRLAFKALDSLDGDYNSLKDHFDDIYSYLDETIRYYLLPIAAQELWNENKNEFNTKIR